MRRLTGLRLLIPLWVCALLRLLPAAARERPPSRPLDLPDQLEGEAAQRLSLTGSEQVLLRAPGVAVQRRRYGSSEVALITSSGLKELHPPSVCLRASGLEVVERGEAPGPGGSLGWLRVRPTAPAGGGGGPAREQHFAYLYFDERRVTGSFWRRSLISIGQQLGGEPGRWSTLQVLDVEPGRARRRLWSLLAALQGGAR